MPEQQKRQPLLRYALMEAGLQIVPILKTRWLWLLFTLIVGLSCEMYFEYMMNLDPYNDVMRIIGQLGLALSAILVSLCVLFIAPLTIEDLRGNKKPTSVWKFSSYHFWPLTLESVRALAHVLFFIGFFAVPGVLALIAAYTFVIPHLPDDKAKLAVTGAIVGVFLILPGFYKFLRLHFMPYIIMFDPKYDAGEVNAIKRSYELTKPIMGRLFLFLTFGAAIELGLDAPPSLFEGSLRDITRIAISPLTILFSVYSVSVSYFMFQKRHETTAHRANEEIEGKA